MNQAELPKQENASLFLTLVLQTIIYEEVLKLLAPPCVLRTISFGEVITVQNGRNCPYLKAGTDSRTYSSECQINSSTLDLVIEIYSKPKERRCGMAKPPLKDFGVDLESGKQININEDVFRM